jgi:DNA segregation ATPase FtsK/SpoIIIE-like protein
MSDQFFDRERAALSRLAEANKARVAAEAELAAAFQTASDKAEREVNRARKTNAAGREHELGGLDTAHTADHGALVRKFDAEQFALNRARDDKRSTLTEKYRAAEQRGQAEYKDKLWSIDSQLEAGEKEAKATREALERKAATGEEQVARLWDDVVPLVGRLKLTRADVGHAGPLPDPEEGEDPTKRMQKAVLTSADAVEKLRALFWPKLANRGGLVLFLLIGGGLGAIGFAFLSLQAALGAVAGGVLVLGLGLWLLVKWIARKRTRRAGKAAGEQLALATRSVELLRTHARTQYEAEHRRLVERHARKREETDNFYLPRFAAQKKQFEAELARAAAEHEAAAAEMAKRRDKEIETEEAEYTKNRAEAEARLNASLAAAEKTFADKMAAATAARDAAWDRMAGDWRAAVGEVTATVREMRGESSRLFPEWDKLADPARPLSDAVPPGIRYGDLALDLNLLSDGVPTDERLAPPVEMSGPLPAFLPFPDRASVVLKARDDGRAAAVTALQAMMLRYLTGLPPGKVRFTIVDPVGLGENFAAFMHLADFDEKLVNQQIWTEHRAIEQKLTDLTEHIASVHQKYLRNQYASIEEYNRAAGEVAEPYRVLVVANFPANFTPEAAKRLVSIVNSGPSCGVCALVGVDSKATMPRDFAMADLEAPSFVLGWKDGKFSPRDTALSPFPLALDRPPDPAGIAAVVQKVGKSSKDSYRVEVPFEYIAPKPGDYWKGSAAKGFDVAVGRAGATRRQVFSLGRGTAQHALVAGKTGSGKSTLLHALITNLALTYSPEEAELYLIDFKEGVEFQWYATYRLPHARVVAIQSEREFGLSVLQRLDGILKERGEKFVAAGVNDLASYRAEKPGEITPRILLVVDEFQMFFVEDDKLSQEAALILDRLVRQGRAFGIHVLLGSQSLGGAYSLPRSTLDQMAVRIALQSSEADANMILSKDNTAARLLSRPGEAIYNDQNGLVGGNDPFQVVWLSDDLREKLLEGLHGRAGDRYPPPLVFQGNTTADPATNPALNRAIGATGWAEPKAVTAWLGDPVAIKEPTAAVFRPQGGSNLMLIGQNEEAGRGLFAASLLGLAAQIAPPDDGSAPFVLLDGTPDDADDAEYLRKVAARLPHPTRTPDRSGLGAALAELATEVDRRQKGETADRSPRFLFVFGVHRFRELRKADDDFGFGRRGADREPTPAERFANVLKEGPAVGVHVVIWCDSLTNLNRSFDRQLLREFAMRVLFQMSPTDSSTLMDSPAASRLGRTRALLLQEEVERPEKFRPYGPPAAEWLDQAAEQLRGRVNEVEDVHTP